MSRSIRAVSSATFCLVLIWGHWFGRHSTVPPYLTAYYTLRPGTNEEIAAAVRGVAVEEMLHLTIAANLLVALGDTRRLFLLQGAWLALLAAGLPAGELLGGTVGVAVAQLALGAVCSGSRTHSLRRAQCSCLQTRSLRRAWCPDWWT